MSQPTVGYPDHQAYAQWRGEPLFGTGFTVTNGAPLIVQNWVTNFESLAINVQFGVGTGVTLTVTFYTDSTLTVPCGFYTWVLSGSGVDLQVIVPCLGDWMFAELSTGQAGSQQGNMTLEPSNIPVDLPAYQQSGNYIAGHNVTINPGVTLVITLPFVVEGLGYFRVEDNTAGKQFDMTCNVLTEGGATLTTIDRQLGQTGGQKLTGLQIPALTTQILIKNDDVAAQTFTYFFMVNPQ